MDTHPAVPVVVEPAPSGPLAASGQVSRLVEASVAENQAGLPGGAGKIRPGDGRPARHR